MAQRVIMLSRVEKELPAASDVARPDNLELQEIMENAANSMQDLIAQLDDQMHLPGDSFEHLLYKLLFLDKELRSIRGLLKVEMAKKIQFEKLIEVEKCKLSEIENNPEYDDGIRGDIRNRIKRLIDDLKIRKETSFSLRAD